MKYLKTFEKLGVSYIIDDMTEEIWDVIGKKANDKIVKFEFYYPVEKLSKEFTGGVPVTKFKICVNTDNINDMQIFFSKDGKSIEANLNIYPYADNQIATLSHELIHFYQHLRAVDFKGKSINIKNKNLNSLYYTASEHDEEFLDILKNVLDFVYISLEDEVNARTQECYRELIEGNITTKKNFVENLKKTDVWEHIDMYDKCFEDTMKVIYKDPVKWYKKLIYAWKNEKKKGLWNKIKSFFSDAEIDNIEVTKEEATALFQEIEGFVHPQMKKFRRKLYRLYDHF